MKKIKLFPILIVFCFLLSLSAVNADDNIITINNNTSIQETIDLTEPNGIINLNPGIYSEHNIIIDKNLTIQGNGIANEIIIDGNHNPGGIFNVKGIVTVEFKNITVINGYNTYGGAINCEDGPFITVENSIFINNTADTKNGGAIAIAGTQHWQPGGFVDDDGYIKIKNCQFYSNSAGHDGGALCLLRSHGEITDSIFKYNYAVRDGGALRVGIFSTANVKNCLFENNRAKEWGGALYNWPGELTVNNCTLNNNSAGERGGAIITSGPLTVTDSQITNNNADTGDGGAIYVTEETPQIPSTVIINNNEIYNNTALKEGDDIYIGHTTSTESNFEDNYWGNDNPLTNNETPWENRFNTNGYFDNPENWIIKPVNTQENSSTPTNPNEQENESSNLPSIPIPVINTVENILNTFNGTDNTIFTNNTNGNSNVGNSNEDLLTTEIVEKNNTSKSANPNYVTYLIVIIVVLLILAYGYVRYNKK